MAASQGHDTGARLVAEVRGRVQGVGFRYFVQEEARRLGLSGYARNLPNGRQVLVVAEGARASLERLVEALRRGPRQAYVEDVAVSWGPATGEFAGFSIN
ncbi:MAG TPA: acylphosphatase [Chloroflexota bacterium]|jgi:acylphosphatase|nr:acylphosphatase [Chloroflexota bacterium]